MGLSDKAFVDEVFSRYAQMPSKQVQEQREPQSLAELIKEDDDDKNLRQSLGAVDEPMLTKDQAMEALTEVVGTWDSSIEDEEFAQLHQSHFEEAFSRYQQMSQESEERFNVLFASDFLHDAMQLTEADKQNTTSR